jgi:hypothetical protein
MNWERFDNYRVIPEWSAYQIGPEADVWSMPRQVPCKGGATRHKAAKKLSLSKDGRVTLCQGGKSRRYHVVRELFPVVFPELAYPHPQVECRNGHPLSEFDHEILKMWMTPKPNIARWGAGNRICLSCCSLPDIFDAHTYSRMYGTAGVPEYSGLPARPKLFGRRPDDGDRDQLGELEWGSHGFIISNSPLSNVQVD